MPRKLPEDDRPRASPSLRDEALRMQGQAFDIHRTAAAMLAKADACTPEEVGAIRTALRDDGLAALEAIATNFERAAAMHRSVIARLRDA